MENILIVAPHADDETLGCGGTILRYINEGKNVYWLLCSQFYRYGKTPENIKSRQEEIRQVSWKYGFAKTFELEYEAAGLTFSDIGGMVGKISNIIKEVKPDTIFLPNRSDVHTDHQIVFKAAFGSTKFFNFPFIKKVLMYETISETEYAPAVAENYFVPTVFVNVSEFFEKKLEIMTSYESELMKDLYPRSISSITALGRYRGSTIGVKYAEAFMLLKETIQ